MTSSNRPVLAIVIPIYGHPSLLIDAVESALRQETPDDYRVVLVNDGCPSPQSDLVCFKVCHHLDYPKIRLAGNITNLTGR